MSRSSKGRLFTTEVGVLPIGEAIRVKKKNRIFRWYKCMCKEIISRTLWALKYPPQRIAFIGFQVWDCVLSGGISLCYSVIFCSLMVLSLIFGWVFRICLMSLCLQKGNLDYYIVFYLHLRLSYPCPTKLEGGLLDSPCPSDCPSVRLSVDDMVSGA